MFPTCILRRRLFEKSLTTHLRSRRDISNLYVRDKILISGHPYPHQTPITIPELLIPKYEKFEKHVAFECGESGRKYTFGQLRKKSDALHRALIKKLKLQKGDVVGIVLKNIPEYQIAFLGSLQANLIVTPINPGCTADEISRQLLSTGAKAVITAVEFHGLLIAACKKATTQIPTIVIKTKKDQTILGGAINFTEFTDNEIDCPRIDPPKAEDVAVLPFSSGTTGLPKGVELTHHNFTSNILQSLACQKEYATEPSDDYQDCLVGILPFYHIYGLSVVSCMTAMNGNKVVTLSDFTPDLFVSILDKNKITMMHLVPPLVMFLSAFPAVKKEYLEHLKVIYSGAAPLLVGDEKRLINKYGTHFDIIQGYGLTETSPTICGRTKQLQLLDEKKWSGSVGTMYPGTIGKIVSIDDPKNTPLGPNVRGELLAKGPQVMKGYFKNPEETKKTIVDDGWLRTGDEAYYNEDGIIFITDRFKEMIKVKGLQVAPAELEELIRSHPDVIDAAVIGIEHPTHGEVPRAYVVARNKDIDLEELNEFVSGKVAPYKQLQGGIALISGIPKSPAGKIMRRKMKEDYQNKIKAGESI